MKSIWNQCGRNRSFNGLCWVKKRFICWIYCETIFYLHKKGAICKFCGMLMDGVGAHALSCMGAGEQTVEHNAVRDVMYDDCKRGCLRPDRETPDLLTESDPFCKDWPADGLVVPHLVLARQLPDGSRAIRTEKVCFDFAVINALGQGHWADTALGGGRAAESYDVTKRRRKNTEQRCLEHGLRFWPVVREQQGGMSKSACIAFRSVARAVAMKEHRDSLAIEREMLHRIAVVVARSKAQRIARRMQRTQPSWVRAARRAVDCIFAMPEPLSSSSAGGDDSGAHWQ